MLLTIACIYAAFSYILCTLFLWYAKKKPIVWMALQSHKIKAAIAYALAPLFLLVAVPYYLISMVFFVDRAAKKMETVSSSESYTFEEPEN